MKPQPPRLLLRFFRWFCHPDLVKYIEGDLIELFEERAREKGVRKAKWLFAWDVVKLFRPGIIKNFEGQTRLNNYGMFLNFYTSAVRNLIKHKSYFLINILGLTLGITSFVFIGLFVLNELSYDRFHSKHERIYRVSNEAFIRGEQNHQATTAGPMAQVLLNDYSDVQKATRIAKVGSMLVGKGGELTLEENILFSDTSFFKIFDFELIQGNPKSALRNPRSMVLSETYAKKYFGGGNALGQKMVVEEDGIFYTVTGVVKDPPPNSHIKFDMLGSINTYKKWNGSNWVGGGLHTYVLMKDGVDIRDFEERIHEVFYKHMAPQIEYYTGLKIAEWEGSGNQVGFKLTPIADIHLKSDATGELESVGNITYIYVYGFIGIVILLIAIFNFVNLATAHSSTRAREVGVRKVIGSSKKLLIYQFLTESVLISVLAMLVATVTTVLLEQPFEELIGKELTYDLLSSHWSWVALIGLALVIGILSGFYPSFILSSFEPISVLKGASGKTSRAGW